MRRWLSVVTGSMALVALWALPPSTFEPPPRNATPEALHLERVEREVARTHAALRALRWSDSLSVLAVSTADEGVVLRPPRGDGIEAPAVAAWEESQRSALAARSRRDPEMIVGVFWQPLGQGSLPGVRALARGAEMTFVGARDGRPYCLRAIPYIRPDVRMLQRPLTDVGPCTLYGAYGAPGAGIKAWLEASGLGFARVPVPGWAADFARTYAPRTEGTMRLFGIWRPPLADHGIATQACLAGRLDACARAVSDPDLVAPIAGDRAWLLASSPATGIGGGFSEPPFGQLDDGLLYEWEAEFGPEAFAGFWSSHESVPDAFEANFGVPLGAWVYAWVGRHGELYRAGPTLPWSAVWTSMLVLAGMAGVASAAGIRRRVG